MITQTEKSFDRDYVKLPKNLQTLAERQLALLLENPRHPSLQMKKIKGYKDLWEGRITLHYRFTFKIVGATCLLRRIGTHEIYKNP
jgi:mRNA-degrading endonuclease RelE of RelBE toxin-antitoxin system